MVIIRDFLINYQFSQHLVYIIQYIYSICMYIYKYIKIQYASFNKKTQMHVESADIITMVYF